MPSTFELLEQTLAAHGPERLLEELCAELRQKKDFHGLFYALILQDRLRLGLSPVQVGKVDDIPAALQEPYEQAIRVATRQVGRLLLDEGDIVGAWPFYRMISEPGPVSTAIAQVQIPEEEGEKLQRIIEIALHEGVNPAKGYELVLQRYGICNAITMFGQGAGQASEARLECLKLLVRALYKELSERLAADLESKSQAHGRPSLGLASVHEHSVGLASVHDMVKELSPFSEEEFYHVDLSHLSSVVQFCIDMPVCAELRLATELCEYGMKLAPRFQTAGEPPFRDTYRDHHIFFRILQGEEVEAGLAHFRAQAEAADAEVGTLPAEVYVTLLTRVGQRAESVQAFVRFLGQADARRLSCPGLPELCHETGDFQPLVEVSLRRGDLVNFAAGLLQQRQQP